MKEMPRQIRGISFDYGHVLGGFDPDELTRRLGELSLAVAHNAGDQIRQHMSEAYAAHDVAVANAGHEAGWRALVGVFVQAACPHVDSHIQDRAVQALWLAQPTRNLWRLVPPSAVTLLDELQARQIPMVITSNSEGRVAELLAEVGISHYFRAIFDSGRLGFGKPDPRIFDLAAQALDLPHQSVVHIGDSEAADIVGAHNVGMATIRFDGFVPGAGNKPSLGPKVSTHLELMGLLKQMFDAPSP